MCEIWVQRLHSTLCSAFYFVEREACTYASHEYTQTSLLYTYKIMFTGVDCDDGVHYAIILYTNPSAYKYLCFPYVTLAVYDQNPCASNQCHAFIFLSARKILFKLIPALYEIITTTANYIYIAMNALGLIFFFFWTNTWHICDYMRKIYERGTENLHVQNDDFPLWESLLVGFFFLIFSWEQVFQSVLLILNM